jgi:cobalt-zinc-cadmium efflux system outer membrane protein
MLRGFATATLVALLVSTPKGAGAGSLTPITFARAIALARRDSLDLAAVRGREEVARAEVGVAGTYPNPTVAAGTSTQAARFSAGVSMPLVILGQREAAMDASRADVVTAQVDTEVAWNDVRAATARAFIALWFSAKSAAARADAASIAARLDAAVTARIEVGAAPQVEGLRAHAERLRADADAREAEQLVGAAGSELGRWIGVADGSTLRASGDPAAPDIPPSLAELSAHVATSPLVRRENADARAADARADRERALVRPAFTLELGMDVGDPAFSGNNYRGQIGLEVPLVNQRGAYVDRERKAAAVARSRGRAERNRVAADLDAAYQRFVAVSARTTALATGVVPGAEAAANATEEAYAMGRSALVAVLDAERARIDARLGLLEARAARASAWVDVEFAVGSP